MSPPFFTSTVLVRLSDGTIQRNFLQFCIKAQDAENIIKNAIFNPFAEAAVNSFP